MQRKTKRRLAAVALVAAVAAIGGNAFTNSVNGVDPDVTAGYASTTVHGATALNVQYNYSPNKAALDNIDLTLQGDTQSAQVRVGFNDDTPTATCQVTVPWTFEVPETRYTCVVNTPVVSILSTQITVIDNDPQLGP